MSNTGFRRLRPAALLGAAALILLPGCNDGGSTDLRSPDPAAMASVATDVALVESVGLQAYVIAGLALTVGALGPDRGPGSAAPAPADTVLEDRITCPTVITGRDAGTTTLRLDYGSGCTATLDSLRTSGSILYAVTAGTPSGFDLSAEFDRFARGGRLVDGILDVTAAGAQRVEIAASALNLNGPGPGGVLVDGSFTARLFPIEVPPVPVSPYVPWRITEGSATVYNGSVGYTVGVSDTLTGSTGCPYPTGGEIVITAAGLLPARVDFGDGTCDDQAVLTVAGSSRTITLGYPGGAAAPEPRFRFGP